jgi:hypothetical protein
MWPWRKPGENLERPADRAYRAAAETWCDRNGREAWVAGESGVIVNQPSPRQTMSQNGALGYAASNPRPWSVYGDAGAPAEPSSGRSRNSRKMRTNWPKSRSARGMLLATIS